MARPLRIELPNAVYHVTARGNRADAIFLDNVDRLSLLAVCEQAFRRFDASALAWCLMDNHYDMVVLTRQANLSGLMRRVNGVYTQAFNRRHGKEGHVFQGRFKAILVDRDKHLIDVCRHVELNPVRAGSCERVEGWAWSSHAQLIGLRPVDPWLDAATVWGSAIGYPAQTKYDQMLAAKRYAELVAADQGQTLWATHLRQQIYLGDELFVARVHALINSQSPGSSEIPRTQRAHPNTLSRWLELCVDRNQAIYQAHTKSFMSLSSIARSLGLSTSRISRIVKSIDSQNSQLTQRSTAQHCT